MRDIMHTEICENCGKKVIGNVYVDADGTPYYSFTCSNCGHSWNS